MSTSTKTAKKRLFLNITSNITAVLIISLIGIWLTPYLIRKLGVAVYGMVPLAGSIVAYFGLFSQTVSGAVGRFVALSVNVGDYNKANLYFNSALFGLISICAIMVIPSLLLYFFLPDFIQIPVGYENDFRSMFILIILSSFITTVTTPFFVSTFVTHSFYVENLGRITSKLIFLSMIVLGFMLFSVSLVFVGFAFLGMAVFLLCFIFLITKRITPELKIQLKDFKWNALGEMGGMGAWMVLDRVGQLLYLNTDLIIINIFLGPEQAGYYAPILQLVLLMRIFTPSIVGVFAPVAIDLIARDETEKLSKYTQQSIKFMGLLLALPIGLLCGFSDSFIQRWLGSQFVHLSPLVWLLLGPHVIFLSINPLYNINRGLNKVKIPAIVTLIGGVTNAILAISFIKFTSMGLFGVALATVISYGIRNMFFHPIYAASNLNVGKTVFFKSSLFGLGVYIPIAAISLFVSSYFDLITYYDLFIAGIIISIIYFLTCYIIVLDDNERTLLRSLVGTKRSELSKKSVTES